MVGDENCSEKVMAGFVVVLREGATAAPSPLIRRTPTMMNGIRFFIYCPRTILVMVTVFKRFGYPPILLITPIEIGVYRGVLTPLF
jgi:hypothetical protein